MINIVSISDLKVPLNPSYDPSYLKSTPKTNLFTYLSSESGKRANSGTNWKVAIPVAGGIVGLVLLVTVMYLFLKHRRSIEQRRREREACISDQPSAIFESPPVSSKSTEKLIFMNELGPSTEA